MNQFIINENGVCTNPISKTFKCSNRNTATIDVAQFPNGTWNFSDDFNSSTEGWGSPCWDNPETRFNSQSKAYECGLKEVIFMIERRNEKGKYDRILSILKEELNPVADNQLSLF